MASEELARILQSEPVKPLRLTLTGGSVVDIEHPRETLVEGSVL